MLDRDPNTGMPLLDTEDTVVAMNPHAVTAGSTGPNQAAGQTSVAPDDETGSEPRDTSKEQYLVL